LQGISSFVRIKKHHLKGSQIPEVKSYKERLKVRKQEPVDGEDTTGSEGALDNKNKRKEGKEKGPGKSPIHSTAEHKTHAINEEKKPYIQFRY
jgi:hypothetical protein